MAAQAALLHARFALGDRLRHENAAMARFGRDGIGRSGQVLVATQVVEASLDLDFDVMVSDLAPVGALIQRAGRLWRHMDRRPVADRPVSGPVLTILSPDPDQVTDSSWLNRVLDRGAWVYRHDHQWLTARAMFRCRNDQCARWTARLDSGCPWFVHAGCARAAHPRTSRG